MGGSLGVGEPEQRTEALPRCGETQSALGCHCCSGGKGCRDNSPLLSFYAREQNQRNFFLNDSSPRAAVSVRLRVDFVAVEEKLLCAHRIHPRFLFCAHPSLQGGMNLDRIAEAARAPPPRDVAPAFHLPRTSNSSRDTLENSSSESSDTDLAGTAPGCL